MLAVTTVALILTAGAGAAPTTAPYVGQADVHGDRIVFTAEDDLWSCDRQGGDVRRLTSRADLGDLVGQLHGEASTSHSYVFGGDPGKQVPRVPVGLLGAELEREDDAYRIARILRGDPADRVRSPLDEPGADADAGDDILAVAGRPVADAPNLHALLAGLAGKQVLLTVADDRTRSGAIDIYPARTLNGPFVVLTNQNAGSDGDIFPQAVQLEGLAPVIGTRSWGGVVGITGLRPLQDGGLVTQPMVAWWDPREGWGVENHGVEPDFGPVPPRTREAYRDELR